MSLLKSASELEEYAREAEYACANMIQMLRPTFDAYEIEPPALPQPLPLTAYPLDFTSPQCKSVCMSRPIACLKYRLSSHLSTTNIMQRLVRLGV